MYFTGLKDVVVGVVRLLVNLVTLDFEGMKSSLDQIVGGLKGMVEGYFTALAGVLGDQVVVTVVMQDTASYPRCAGGDHQVRRGKTMMPDLRQFLLRLKRARVDRFPKLVAGAFRNDSDVEGFGGT